MKEKPVRRALWEIEEETLRHGGKPRALCKMLFSGGRTATDRMTCGVATLGPETPLPLHRHPQPEVYFGLQGDARAVVGGEEFRITPGVALYIPGDVPHELHAESPLAHVFFAFAVDNLEEVTYVYLDEEPA